LALLAIYSFGAACHVRVKFVPVIPVVGQCRMDLAKREEGELEVQLLWAPAKSDLGRDEFYNLHRRSIYHRDIPWIEDDMLIARFGERHCPSPSAGAA